jgi:hypothetical protein
MWVRIPPELTMQRSGGQTTPFEGVDAGSIPACMNMIEPVTLILLINVDLLNSGTILCFDPF